MSTQKFSGVTKRILCIEDSSFDFKVFRQKLECAGRGEFECKHASRFPEALSYLEQERFDAIILDLSLCSPGTLENLRTLRKKTPNIPVLILTADDDDECAMRAINMGAQDYIIKGQITGRRTRKLINYAIEREHITQILRERKSSFKRDSGIFERDEVFDLRDLINSVSNLVAENIVEKETVLHIHSSSDVPRQLQGHKIKLYQIIACRLCKAIKHTTNGMIDIDVSLKNTDITGKHTVRISISDTGDGMKQSDLYRMQQFLEGKSLGDQYEDLAICKENIESMGGYIEVKSELGLGTTVILTVKLDSHKSEVSQNQFADLALPIEAGFAY